MDRDPPDEEGRTSRNRPTRTRRDLLGAAATTVAAALTGYSTVRHRPARPSIAVPDRTLVGEPVRIRLAGFDPSAEIRVEATATDSRGVEFSGVWTRRADETGSATISDLDRATSPSASTADSSPTDSRWAAMGPGFESPDPAGVEMLLQRLAPETDASPSNFVVGEQSAVDVTLTASVGGNATSAAGTGRSAGARRASATTTRIYADPGVSKEPIEESGLVGWLYRPPGEGPHPGLLALHGSEAYVPHELSRTLATHGYAALALRYFDAEGLPPSLDGVPVEYFRRATRWLTDRNDVRADAVGFVGVSRGVEAALLSAAEFSGPSAVVGYSGGGVLGPSIDRSATEVEGWESAWTRDGEPLADADAVRSVFTAAQNNWYECDTADCVPPKVREQVPADALRSALAPVEEVDGPVLLLAGAQDFNWPAPGLSALAIDRLDRRGHAAPYRLRTYDGAGHVFGLPYRSYTGEATGPTFGGSARANAFAAANSWPVVLRYLRSGLKKERTTSFALSDSGDNG